MIDISCFNVGFPACSSVRSSVLTLPYFQASPGIIANPFASGIVRKNSMESISSIDRDLSPEEMDIMQKESEMARETSQWEREEMEKVERMRLEREEATRLLEEETENLGTGPLKLDYKTLAALPTTSLQKVNRVSLPGSQLSLTVCRCQKGTRSHSIPLTDSSSQHVESRTMLAFSDPVSLTDPMEAPLQAEYGPPLEPLGFGLPQPTKPLTPPLSTEQDYLHGSQFSTNGTSTSTSTDSALNLGSPFTPEEEEESLVDSQPICFKENPFLVANRRGKGLPPGERILSGPPVGYGRQGQLQPWLFSKARRLPACGLEAACCVYCALCPAHCNIYTPSLAPSSDYTRTDSPIREAPYSPTIQPPSHHSSDSSLSAGRETRFVSGAPGPSALAWTLVIQQMHPLL
ncbi:unnamed protein product [Menidia menidia]|uniref:(Atlantic silverside) hypothetical protein n=1 Tax=Menidia menidia TaxID=238744 RepID=A0A8S4AU34_9TELE|nr:unnamed protein product [Menidia menidia]